MSHLSGALKALLERRPRLTQADLANRAKVSQGQFSKYINDTSRPDCESIERLCAALPEEDRAMLAAAFTRDCIPESARGLVTVSEKKGSPRAKEEPPSIDLPRAVRGAWVRLGERARDDADTADWLLGIDRILAAAGPRHRKSQRKACKQAEPKIHSQAQAAFYPMQ